jgi:hypothetical protein
MIVGQWATYKTPDGVGTSIAKDRVLFVEREVNGTKVTFLSGASVVLSRTDVQALANELGLHANLGGSDGGDNGKWLNIAAIDAVTGVGDSFTIFLQNGMTVNGDGRADQLVWGLKVGEAQRLGVPFAEAPPEGTVITTE